MVVLDSHSNAISLLHISLYPEIIVYVSDSPTSLPSCSHAIYCLVVSLINSEFKTICKFFMTHSIYILISLFLFFPFIKVGFD